MKLVLPQNYDILFEPDLKTFKFGGKETISLDIWEPTDALVLNAADLEIRACGLVQGGKLVECKFELDKDKEELTVRLPEKAGGKAELSIEFAGELNNKLAGFYRSKYKGAGGSEKHIATTQFEAADARRAFPCWDEPEAKATFDISILADPGLDAISNMPVAAKKKVGRKTLFRFDRTPVMSTYLLYLGVGEFDYLEGRLDKIKIRIVATKGKKDQCELALDMTKKFLDYYQKYFGIPYPLKKLDMIAVPDFSAGAMENWGAITFRESALLYNKKTSSTITMRRVAEVVAHELAHQWFGNLVTMRWWNDLWLNESFATFMSYKAVDHYYPEWDFWDQFVDDAVDSSLSLDALKSSHPIDVEVKRPSDIRQIFDEISYEKGGSVLRMLEDYLGEEDFRKGLGLYLTEHKYGNATTDDLWDHLAEASGKPVKEMMDTWVRQVGYPIIEAKVEDSKLSLTQKRFLLSGDGDQSQRWMIPLSVKMKSRFVSKLMDGKTEEILLEDGEDWFKVNFGEKGFYRVKYEQPFLEMLKESAMKKEMDNTDRWGINNDMFALCIAGDVGMKEYLDFAKCFDGEDDYLVLDELTENLYVLYLITSQEGFWNQVVSFNRDYFRKVFERIGWDAKDGEKPTIKLLRGSVISALGRFGDEEIILEARRRFGMLLEKPESVDPNIHSAIYSLVAWAGDEAVQEQMKELYRKAKTQEEKMRFLAAVCSPQDEKLLQRALDYSLSDDVRFQDMFIPIVRVAGNPHGRKLVWPWLKRNWKTVSGRLMGMGQPLLRRMVEAAGSAPDEKDIEDIRDFFKKNPAPGTEMALAQTLERMGIRARFLERARKEFA